MIRVGELYADEATGGVLRVVSIRCLFHGAVKGARMVLGAEPPPEREWVEKEPDQHHARVNLSCPHCSTDVVMFLKRHPRGGDEPARADLPITPSSPEGTK